jgi:hypothetical protein
MSLQGQVWTFINSINDYNYYIIQDNGRVPVNDRYEYSYLLYCVNLGKKIEYLIGEPIQEHGSWKRVA